MYKPTVENLYSFIVSQLPKKYGKRSTRALLDYGGVPLSTALLISKGPGHFLAVSYGKTEKEFKIYLRKPQGWINEVVIHKYA